VHSPLFFLHIPPSPHPSPPSSSFFFFNATATPELYTLSLHDALPISHRALRRGLAAHRRRPLERLRPLPQLREGGGAVNPPSHNIRPPLPLPQGRSLHRRRNV